MAIRRHLIFLFCFISLRGFLAELLMNPPITLLQSIQSHEITACPCVLEADLCTDVFNVPVILSPKSKDWYVISSQNLSLQDGILQCKPGFARTKIREGSFALLPKSSIVHVHSGLIFDSKTYCFEKSYSDDFTAYVNGQGIAKLDATVCFEPPALPLCCPEGEIMSERNGSAVCDKSTLYTPPLNPKVVFDGEFHDWSSQGVHQFFPECNYSLTFMPIQNNQVQRSLDVVDGGVRFFWETGELGKVFISQPNFCVGQITSYSSLSPAVAFCKEAYSFDKLCRNKTCFSKCCPNEYVFDLSTVSCEMDEFYYTWSPPSGPGNVTMLYGMPSCPSYFPLSAVDPSDQYALLDNGSLWLESHNSAAPPSRYCIDYFRNHTHMIEAVLVCFDDSTTQAEPMVISALIYVILLLVSSLQLLVTTGIFLYRVINARRQRENLRSGQTSENPTGCRAPFPSSHFHALVCEMMIFSSLQLLFVAVQQAFTLSLDSGLCNFFATTAGVMELSAVGDLCFLCVQYTYATTCSSSETKQKYRWLRMSFHALPVVASVSIVVTTRAVLLPPAADCAIDASMIDPWTGYPVTCAAVGLLLVAIVLLYKDFLCHKLCNQKVNQPDNLHDCEKIKYRWWLCAKMVFIHSVYWVSYVSVWMSDSLAFWVFVDIALVLKACFISCSLLRHHARHLRDMDS